jgi:hypothetical protein
MGGVNGGAKTVSWAAGAHRRAIEVQPLDTHLPRGEHGWCEWAVRIEGRRALALQPRDAV